MTRRVIIDTDPGTDDAIALFLAFSSPELDIRLISVAGGNVGLTHTLANARGLVGLSGVSIPVVAGADRPLVGRFAAAPDVHGDDGMMGVRLPAGPPATPGVAADAIRAELRAAPVNSITLIGIGPATNLALALATEPALADRVAEIVLMTGAWAEGNITPSAEFNAFCDPEALQILFDCGRPVTLATLELTAQALCTPAHVATLRGSTGGACLRAAAEILGRMKPSRRLGGRGAPQHDSCAVAWVVAPHLFTSRPAHAMVNLGEGPDRGRTVIDRWGRNGLPANVTLLDTLDADGFFALLAARLPTLP